MTEPEISLPTDILLHYKIGLVFNCCLSLNFNTERVIIIKYSSSSSSLSLAENMSARESSSLVLSTCKNIELWNSRLYTAISPSRWWPWGAGSTSVVTGLTSPVVSMYKPCFRGSANCCWAILLWTHTVVWIWMCCLREPGVGGMFLCSAIFLQNRMMSSQLGDASNLDGLWLLCNRDECSQHREQVIGDFSGIQKHRQSLDDFSIRFERDMLPGCLAYTREPLSVEITCLWKYVKGWQTPCSLCTQSSP